MDPNLPPTQSYDVGVLYSHLQTHSPEPRPRDLLPSLLEAGMIMEQAQEYQVTDDFEAGWNSHVHGPLLLLACHMSRHYKRVRSVNLTLAPRLRQHQRVSITGKMVDFGIYLQPSPVLRDAYKEIEPEADGESRYFNHTNLEQIARKPLAIGIDTKREDQGGSQADLQLSVWVHAHFDRLAGLRRMALNVDDRTIWLPLLKVIGPIWYLLLARGDYNELGELAGACAATTGMSGRQTLSSGSRSGSRSNICSFSDRGIVRVPFAHRRTLVISELMDFGSGQCSSWLKLSFSNGLDYAASRFICLMGLTKFRERLLDVVDAEEVTALMFSSCSFSASSSAATCLRYRFRAALGVLSGSTPSLSVDAMLRFRRWPGLNGSRMLSCGDSDAKGLW